MYVVSDFDFLWSLGRRKDKSKYLKSWLNPSAPNSQVHILLRSHTDFIARFNPIGTTLEFCCRFPSQGPEKLSIQQQGNSTTVLGANLTHPNPTIQERQKDNIEEYLDALTAPSSSTLLQIIEETEDVYD